MQGKFKEVGISDIGREMSEVAGVTMSEDVLVTDMPYVRRMNPLFHPLLFDGFFALYCYGGSISLEINMKQVTLEAGDIFLYMPENTVRLISTGDGDEDTRLRLVAVSRKMMSGTFFDYSKLFDKNLNLLEVPCLRLGEEERRICTKYIEITEEIIKSAHKEAENAIPSLISSLFYLVGSIWKARLALERQSTPGKSGRRGMRKRAVLEKFLVLAKENHAERKSLSFYSDELCLTPRYLSKMIQDESGKSAHEWLNLFILLDAKNLLKFTDLSVKDIAYELKFESQTSFFKFFKKQTGMTPVDYRKS